MKKKTGRIVVIWLANCIWSYAGTLIGQDDFDTGTNYLTKVNSNPANTTVLTWAAVSRSTVAYDGFVDTSRYLVNGSAGDGTDILGILKSTKTDYVFGLYRGGTTAPRTLTYAFNILHARDLSLSMDWAACGDLPPPGITVTASIDGGVTQTVFEIGYSGDDPVYRMEDGRTVTYARSAIAMTNGIAAGTITNDFTTYVSSIAGYGSNLTLTVAMTSTGAGRPYALDNLKLYAGEVLKNLDALETVSGGYPTYFRFQETAWFAERLKTEFNQGLRSEEASYALWRDAFKPYQGLLTSRFERNPSESFVRSFTDRFKQDYPDKMVIWQTSGLAWYWYNDGSQFEYYHPAHFLYSAGASTTGAVSSTDTKLNFSVMPSDVPVDTNYNTYVVLIDRDSAGNLDWNRVEEARVISKTTSTLTVQRGAFSAYPALNFPNGAYVAAHTDISGPWLFNFSTAAPVDPVMGLQGWQARAEHLASLFKKESSAGTGDQGDLWKTDGLEFDAVGDVKRACWSYADCNMDGQADEGRVVTNGAVHNTYMDGIVQKFALLKERLSDTNYVNAPKFVLSDPVQYGHQFLYGVEKEAQGTDLDYSVVNLVDFYNFYSGGLPTFNYFNQKFVDWATQQNKFRLNLGMATIYDAKWTDCHGADRNAFAVMDDAPDEVTKGDKMVVGWLGQPVGEPIDLGLADRTDQLNGRFNPLSASSMPYVSSTGGGLSIQTNRLVFSPASTNSWDSKEVFYALRIPVSSNHRLHGQIDLQSALPAEIAGLTRFGKVTVQSFIDLAPTGYQYETNPISSVVPVQWVAATETVNDDDVNGWNIFARKLKSNMYTASVYNIAPDQKLLLYFKGYDTTNYPYTNLTLKVYVNGNTNSPILNTVISRADANILKTYQLDLSGYNYQNIGLKVEVSRGNDSGLSRSYCWLSLGRLIFSDMSPNFVHRKIITESDEVTGEPVVSYKEEYSSLYVAGNGSFYNGFMFTDIATNISMVNLKVELDHAAKYYMGSLIVNDEPAAFAREFENGYVLVNNNGTNGASASFHLPTLFGVTEAQKLQCRTNRAAGWVHNDTATNDGSLVGPSVTVPSDDALFLIRTQNP